MIKFIPLSFLLVLSGCNLDDNSGDNPQVCAMDNISTSMSNLAVIFKSQLEAGDWRQVSMSYCDDGAGQLYFNQPDNGISFKSKYDDITYYSKSLDYQLGLNDWFYVENKTGDYDNNPLILEKDENENIYKVYYLESESEALLETYDIEEVKTKYPSLTTNPRAKTAKELEDLYLTYLSL